MVPAKNTSTMHINTAKVSRKGAAIQQTRPALTIVADYERSAEVKEFKFRASQL